MTDRVVNSLELARCGMNISFGARRTAAREATGIRVSNPNPSITSLCINIIVANLSKLHEILPTIV